MGGPRDCDSEQSKSDREREMYNITYIWNLKMVKINLFRKHLLYLLLDTHCFHILAIINNAP